MCSRLEIVITIRDIAREAQVSVSTVSRVLNNKPDVKTETKDIVEQTIRELNYSPSSVARGLVLKKSCVIGFIVPDITNPSFPELARGSGVFGEPAGAQQIFPLFWLFEQ